MNESFPMTMTLTANNQTLTLSAPTAAMRRWTWPEDTATEATLREEIDERVEDLLPSTPEAPSGERVLELAEMLSDVCPWLRSLGLERVSDSVVRVAGRRVAMGECEPW